MKKTRVCIAGSSNMDLVTRVERMPVAGETILGKSFKTVFGGKGANQAVIAAKLGADVSMIAKVGRDAFGEEYLKNFRAVGIRTDYIAVSETLPTGIAAITVDDESRNSIIVVAGANGEITVDDIESARPAIESADVALSQLEIPFPSVKRSFEIARGANVPTILNPAPAADLDPALYRLCDFFCPNEIEAAMMSGVTVHNAEDAAHAARVFLDRGAKSVLMTLGSQGSFYTDGKEEIFVPAKKVNAVDTTGAGDCFLGAFSAFYGGGDEIRVAIEKATAAASYSVTRPGAQPSYPTLADLGF